MTLSIKKQKKNKYLLNKDKIEKYMNVFKNIDTSDIIENHEKIKHMTNCNIDNDNPTSCGNTANAILNLSLEYFKKDYANVLTCTDIDHLLCMIGNNRYYNGFVIYKIDLNSFDYTDNFPGHSFILIKLINHNYILFQSYIDLYSLSHWIKSKQNVEINFNNIINIIKNIRYFCNSNIYDDKFKKFWKNLTSVILDDDKLPKNNIYFSVNIFWKEN